jgi:mannose-6-phosphate isomerase-like protein (cupin superfamily)
LGGEEDVKAYMAEEGKASFMGTDIVNINGLNVNLIELGKVTLSYIILPVYRPLSNSRLTAHLLTFATTAPGGCSQFHRTLSIDFVIITNGHMRMQLDTGEFLDLYPGDHVVQRGTMHKWSNPSTSGTPFF